jgi:sialic acid synthase
MSKSVTKPWGSYENIAEEDGRIIKLMFVAPQQTLSLQSHEHREEYWLVLEGTAEVTVNDKSMTLDRFGSVQIGMGDVHRLANNSSEGLCVLEVQSGSKLSETDIVRYQDRYGRKTSEKDGAELGGLSGRLSRQWNMPSHTTPPVLISEIGCNHKGDFDIALEMIAISAQFCKVDVAKFQKRTNRELLSPREYDTPHPNLSNSYGDTYGAHREFLEFDLEQHRDLKAACEEWGLTYATSVWDMTSAREIASLEPALIKIPSAINTNTPVIEYLAAEYQGEVHISLGMTLNEERDGVISVLDKYGRLGQTVLYHCISGYPVDEEDLCLLEIKNLVSQFGDDLLGIGFSGHHRGIAADIGALTLGASHFERHFTLDRTWKGTDHSASLEPDGMRRLARDLRNVSNALNYKTSEVTDIEKVQRDKLKKFAT